MAPISPETLPIWHVNPAKQIYKSIITLWPSLVLIFQHSSGGLCGFKIKAGTSCIEIV